MEIDFRLKKTEARDIRCAQEVQLEFKSMFSARRFFTSKDDTFWIGSLKQTTYVVQSCRESDDARQVMFLNTTLAI